MKSIRENLMTLDQILIKRNAPILNYLNPGISVEELTPIFVQNNAFISEGLITLFEWHNGINKSVEGIKQTVLELIPMGRFFSANHAFEIRTELIEQEFLPNMEEYLPIFGTGEDDAYLLNLKSGEIIFLSSAAQVWGELMFDSLDIMFECIIQCYNEGIFKIDSKNGLEARFAEFWDKLMTFR